jgi:1-acyl-sn-glycerol-3-phosphate acyltransferase
VEPWRYETARDLDQPLGERLRRFPRQPDILVYGLRALVALWMRGALRLWHRLEVRGREHLPASGSFVLVANHGSHLDAPCLLAALPLRRMNRAFPAAADDYFFSSMGRAAFAAIFVNAVPFSRRSRARASLDLCAQLLAEPGNVLIFFPEGTRSPDGTVGEFKPGIGMLLAGRAVPAVPCFLDGAAAAWPKGAWLPRPRKVRLLVGAPKTFAELPPGPASAERVAAELRQSVLDLGAR